MSILRNLFGKPRLGGFTSKATPDEKPSEELALLKLRALDNLKLLRYLANCGPFNKEKLETYLSMSDQLSPEKKALIRNSAQRIIGGLDDMWFSIVQVHGDALSSIIQMIKALPIERASAQLLEQIVDESSELMSQIAQRKP